MTELPEKKRTFDTFDTRVANVETLTPRVKSIRFELPTGKSVNFKAGQFMQIFIPDGDKFRRTSYSIASGPEEHSGFELCVTLVTGGVS